MPFVENFEFRSTNNDEDERLDDSSTFIIAKFFLAVLSKSRLFEFLADKV